MSDPKSSEPQSVGEKARVAGCLAGLAIPLAVIGWMAFDQFILTRFTAPEQHAERPACIGPVDGDPKWQNTCDETINIKYCLIASATREVCRAHKLAPGKGVTGIDYALAELGAPLVNMSRMACAEPYMPVPQRHPNTGRMRDVCT